MTKAVLIAKMAYTTRKADSGNTGEGKGILLNFLNVSWESSFCVVTSCLNTLKSATHVESVSANSFDCWRQDYALEIVKDIVG